MSKLALKQLWARKRRAIGAGIAVIIGVAFLSATMVLGNAMTQGIEALFVEGYAGTDVQVTSAYEVDGEDHQTIPIPARLAADLGALPEVERALPVVEGTAQTVGSDGKGVGGNGPPTIGANWIDQPRNPFVLIDGRAPAGPGEIVVDSWVAETGELAVGDATTVRVPHPVDVTVVGIAEFGSGTRMGGVTYTWFDTDTAQELLFGNADDVSAVDLQVAPGVSPEQLRDAVEPLLPSGTVAYTNAELTERAMEQMESDFLGFFKVFLLVFAVIALLVACFSINNTFSILVAQRTRESALLRALGASSRQVLTSTTAEALLIGVLASGAGLGAGIGLAHGLNALMTAADAGVPSSGMTPSTTVIVAALVTGIGVTLLAAILPAWRASRVAPLAALRDVAVDRSGASVWRAVTGLVLTGAGVAGLIAGPSTGEPMMVAGLGGLAAFVGFVLLGPVAARLAAAVIGTPIAWLRGTTGKLARGNAMRNPKRTAGTAAALMIGAAVVALFANLASSIKYSMTELIDSSFGGDLVVRPDGFSGAGLPTSLAGDIAGLPEIATAVPLRDSPITFEVPGTPFDAGAGKTDWVVATNVADMVSFVDIGEITGSLDAMGADTMAVSTKWADDIGVTLGDSVQARFADGEVGTLTIAATYTLPDLMGDVLVDTAVLDPHSASPSDFLVLIDVADGVPLDQAKQAVSVVTVPAGDPVVETSDEYLDAMGSQLDSALGLVYGLLALAVIIALIGIANTLSLSLHERTRELGLLRAVGQTRRKLRATVRWESVIISIFGTFGGLALGTFLCWGMVRAIAETEGFAQFAPSYSTLGIVLVVAVVAGVVAAWRPARRASKLDVLDAIATD
ncbi:MAG TPA: FtsX-like permease family protein [Ilumatobacter sp.]|nr:FtsX-like permease family protein [Ilumatobacter sp.]